MPDVAQTALALALRELLAATSPGPAASPAPPALLSVRAAAVHAGVSEVNRG